MATTRSFALIRWIEASPAKAFAAFALLHAAVWTALPTLLYPNLPLDLIEALVYGREWQLGYDKLPPLPWWLVEIAYRLVGQDFAYYLLAQITVVATFAAVFAMARPLIGSLGALVGMLIIDGLHYLNYTADKFNHDVIQLPFWALAGLALHRALRGGAPKDWLLLGLAVGLSLWAKYFALVLALPILVFLLADREARQAWSTPGPYIALATALAVMLPHLVWLVQHDFLPLAYAERRAVVSLGLLDHLWRPLEFAGGQLYFLVPSLFIAAPLFYPRRAAGETEPPSGADAFDRRIVSWLVFGPVVTVLAISAVTGRGTVAMWGYPIWLFLGVWLVLFARRALSDVRLLRVLFSWAIVFCGMATAFIVNYTVLPLYDHRYRAVFFPGKEMAQQLSERYRAATGQPVPYVIGGMWDGGLVEHYASSHPRVLIDGDPARAPWIDPADVKARGALVVWIAGDPTIMPVKLRSLAADAAIQPPLRLDYLRGGGSHTVGWAILLPKRSFARLKPPP
jgi:hypothetical protein